MSNVPVDDDLTARTAGPCERGGVGHLSQVVPHASAESVTCVAVFISVLSVLGLASVFLRLVHEVTHRPVWALLVIALMAAALLTKSVHSESVCADVGLSEAGAHVRAPVGQRVALRDKRKVSHGL